LKPKNLCEPVLLETYAMPGLVSLLTLCCK